MENKKAGQGYLFLILILISLIFFLIFSVENLLEWKNLFIFAGVVFIVAEIIRIHGRNLFYVSIIEKLNRDLKYLRDITDTLPVPIFIYDRERKILFANKSASFLTGKSENELKEKLFNEINIDSPDKFIVIGKENKKHYELVKIPFSSEKSPECQLAVLCDITPFVNEINEVNYEKEKITEAPLYLFIDSVMQNSEGIIYFREKGVNKVIANNFTLKLFDVLKAEDLFFNNDFSYFASDDESVMRNGNCYYKRGSLKLNDDSIYSFETFKIPVKDIKTGFSGMVCLSGKAELLKGSFNGFIPELINRLKDDDSLHIRNRMLEKALESTDSAFWEYDVESALIKFSVRFCSILSLSNNFIMDFSSFISKVHLDDRYDLRNLFASSINENKNLSMKIRIPDKDSGVKWLILSATPVADGSGKVIALSGMATDITLSVNEREAYVAANKRLVKENAMLGVVSVNDILENSSVENIIMKVVQSVAEGLNITSAGFWFIDHHTRIISNIDKYIKEERIHLINENKGIRFDDFLYSYIEDVKVFCVEDVPLFSNQMSEESLLKEIKKEGIKSAMLVGIRVSGKVIGILSVQDCDSTRIWFEDEKNFAVSMGDFISLALEARKCREAGV